MAEAVSDIERVIADPLRFKQRLRIGEDAFKLLRIRKTLFSLWDASGAASAGVAVAKSTVVASAFFAPSAPVGVLAWLGLAAPAATPLGWVIAAGLAAGGGYYGVTRWLASGPDHLVDTIPKFINTPIDLLGAGLFETMAALALRVALADGQFDPLEREAIVEHFVADWGYDPAYVGAALADVEARIDERRLSVLARSLATFQAQNPDCNAAEMQAELMMFLRELVAVDGVITTREERAVKAIDSSFRAHRAAISRDAARRARGLVAAATATVRDAAGAADSAGRDLAERIRGVALRGARSDAIAPEG